MKKWAPVLIEWMDAHGGDEGWTPPNPKWHGPKKVRSVGLLMKHNEVGITVVMSKDGDTVGGYLFVPAVNILSVKELS